MAPKTPPLKGEVPPQGTEGFKTAVGTRIGSTESRW